MNPGSKEQFGLNLPVPVVENQGAIGANYESRPVNIEAKPLFAGDNLAQAAPRAQAYPAISLPPMAASQSVQNNVVPSTTLPVVPATADDGDLIEKEWVNKAKKIIEANRDDPYQQSKELTLFKADYMQKRYNKIIKLSE